MFCIIICILKEDTQISCSLKTMKRSRSSRTSFGPGIRVHVQTDTNAVSDIVNPLLATVLPDGVLILACPMNQICSWGILRPWSTALCQVPLEVPVAAHIVLPRGPGTRGCVLGL